MIGSVTVLVGLVAIGTILLAPYLTTKSDKDATLLIRKGSSIEAIKDSLAKNTSDQFADKVVELLKANDFTVYIVTATERNIVRALVKDTLGISPAYVIGTEYGYTAPSAKSGYHKHGNSQYEM